MISAVHPSRPRAIILDLDRTLLHTDKSLSARAIRALLACRAKGIQIMMATARPYRCTLDDCEKIPFDAMTVTNGAIILCEDQRLDFPMSPQSARAMLELLCAQPGLLISLEMGNEVYSNLPIPDFDSILYDNFPNFPPGEGLYKILVNFEDQEVLSLIEAHLPPDLCYTIAGGHLIQLMSRQAGKWNGIQAMLALAGLTPAQAIYFGDDQDDIAPLRHCGIGVAVENAIDDAKAAADYITKSNDEDGVAVFLESFFQV